MEILTVYNAHAQIAKTGSSIIARFRFSYHGIPCREIPSWSDPRTAAGLPGAE